jgi:putative tryptophan/tyrosine transport system substrate-binding protein
LDPLNRVAAFVQGLETLGWTDGGNTRIDHRFGAGDAERIKTLVAELVNSAPDLIVASSSPAAAALKRATSTIPIVFTLVNDPVGQDFVTSLAHPGGNLTGFAMTEFEVIGKLIELLKEMAPKTRRTTFLFNPKAAPFFPFLTA